MKEQILKIAKDLEQGCITEIEAQNFLLSLFGIINQVCDTNDKLDFFAGICCGIPVAFVGSGTWQCEICEKYHTPQQMMKSEIERIKQTCL
jgi:hypothetical protein